MNKTIQSFLLATLPLCSATAPLKTSGKNFKSTSDNSSSRFESTFETIENQVTFQVKYSLNLFSPDPQNDTLLDIGSGPGLMTQNLLDHYKSVTALDPNIHYLKNFKVLEKCGKFKYILEKFESASFTQKYDNILSSHMMYYIPQKDWGSNLLKMLDLLKTNGKALIVLTAPKGRLHELRMPMNPSYSHSGVLCSTLDSINIPYESQTFEIEHAEPDRQKFIDLINIYTIDDCYSPTEFDALSQEKRDQLNQMIQDFTDASFDSVQNKYILFEACEYISIKK